MSTDEAAFEPPDLIRSESSGMFGKLFAIQRNDLRRRHVEPEILTRRNSLEVLQSIPDNLLSLSPNLASMAGSRASLIEMEDLLLPEPFLSPVSHALETVASFHEEVPVSGTQRKKRIAKLWSLAPALLLVLVSPTFLRRLRRFAVWITIFGIIQYRYWTGRLRFPLGCNLVGVQCPTWPVSGMAATGYESIVDAFKQNFEDGLEIGANFAAFVDGKPVVELYGGFHDTQYSRPYNNQSLQLVFSSSKVLEGIVITYLVDKNLLDFNEKISTYWPEFGQGNKENVTLSYLLGHRAGVTYLDRAPSLDQLSDLDAMARLLAAQPHNFNGTLTQGYHAVTRGWYLNEIVRRVDHKHRTIGHIIKEEFMPILGTEFYVGIPEALENRISPLVGYPTLRMIARILTPAKYLVEPLPGNIFQLFNRKSVSFKALNSQAAQIRPLPHSHNRKEIWRSEGPSYNGITNAISLAKFAALMAGNGTLNGITLISKETLLSASIPLPWMNDAVVTRNVTFANGGWGLNISFPGSSHVTWSGWGGVGGSMVWWNPDRNIGFSYVMNSMSMSGMGDRRSWRLIAKLIQSFEALNVGK